MVMRSTYILTYCICTDIISLCDKNMNDETLDTLNDQIAKHCLSLIKIKQFKQIIHIRGLFVVVYTIKNHFVYLLC